jgi:Transcriptional regulators
MAQDTCPHRHAPQEDGPEWYFRELFQAHRTASLAVSAHYDLKECGQPMILFILDHEYNDSYSPTQKELAERLGISPSTTTISLKSLERIGYVRKVSDEKDMRCKRIEITEKGRDAAHKFLDVFNIINKAMYQGFADEEREMVSHFYSRITENLLKLADHYSTVDERK